MSWIQAFNQPYPGALQYLQTGGMLPAREQNSCYTGAAQAIGLDPAAYGAPRARLANPNWGRASNFQAGVGAIGPAIGLSPMVYGIPFPGYPSLAQQQKVGVTPAESEQWREVYAAQLRDRGIVANPTQESPWAPTAGYGTGQYGSQYGPNQNPREQNAVRRLRHRPSRRVAAPAAARLKCEPGHTPCGRVCCYPGNQCIDGRCKWPIRHPNAAGADRQLNGVVESCHEMCEAIAKGQGWNPDDLPESFGNCWANCITAFTPPEAGGGPAIQAAPAGRGASGRRRRAGRLLRARKRGVSRAPRSKAGDCFGICCGAHEPKGTDCSSKDAKITKPSTWSCMTRCLKVPDPTPGAGGGPSLSGARPRRVPKGCRTCGIGGVCCSPRVCRTITEPGGGTYSACVDRLRNSPARAGRLRKSRLRVDSQPARKVTRGICPPEQPFRCRDGQCVTDSTFCRDRVLNGCYHPGKMNHAGRAVVACRMSNPGSGGKLARRARARLQNPGQNGEFRLVPPFCASGSCGRTHCGTCNPANYAVPGHVDTVAEAVDRMRADIDQGMAAASEATRRMYAPGASAWSDPNVALRSKPGGPAPKNALPTGQWSQCSGPAVAAHPSSNQQIIPGGTP